MKLRETVPKKSVKFSRISISHASVLSSYSIPKWISYIHNLFIFENAWIFLWIFFEPNGAKGKLPSSILIALYTTIHFIFLYAYIYGSRSRIFINGSLFQVSKKLCLIVNLVFILLGPTASSIHRQEKEQNKAKKKMRYKCIHFFLILCTIDFERNRRETKERIWKIYII